MAKVMVDLKIKLAIGIHGIAVISVDETIDEVYGMSRGEIQIPSLTLQDVEVCGAEDWYEHAVDDKPAEPGVYTFTGRASFDDDSSDYSLTCEQV